VQVGHRVLAARDAEGAQPMYWGSTEDGRLLFGTETNDLAGCEPTSTLFPAGVV
jgi:asparagine synthetase B (glutamine-hydrolysing)